MLTSFLEEGGLIKMNIRFSEDNVQKGQFEMLMDGNFTDLQQSKLLIETKLAELLRHNPKVMILDSSDAAIMSAAMWVWAESVIKLLPNCQVVYKPSQLMMCMKYSKDYTSKRPNDVFIEF